MKKIKKLIKLTIITLIIISLSFLYINTTDDLKNDYYDYINKDILEQNPLADNQYSWSTFTSAQEEVDSIVDTIIDQLYNTNNNIKILKNQLLDTNSRNNDNLNSLKPYLDQIDNSNTIEEFITNAITIENTLNIDIFTNIKVDSDYKNTTQNIIYFYPITFDFGASADYYVNEDYMTYKALIKQYSLKILKQYGYSQSEARTISTNLTNMYTSISSNSLLQEDLQDISSYYNIITKEDLQDIYTNLDIDYYLNQKGLSNQTTFSIIDINNYKSLNTYLTKENLPLLKQYVKLKILENYSIYLSEDYNKLIYELNNKLSGTTENNDTNNDKSNSIISSLFSYEIDNYYQQNYFTNEEKEYITNMINEIIEYYETDIDSLTWLSNSTKEKAKLKLQNLTINIGLSSTYPTYSNNYNISSDNTLIENIISISNTINNYELSRLTTNEKEPYLSQTTVNAYYNPLDNSINFPIASTLLFDIDNSYYENLGTIGMIIAHEITHAFDLNGSQFDEKGNLSNWWTTNDYNNYKELEQKVIDYYNQFEVTPNNYINGELTVNENIADLGAVSCITNLANSKAATTSELKEMYTAFANMWATSQTEEYQELLLLQDTHSPSKYRVNATLSSIDTFYKVYKINRLNKMYISPQNRITIW